MSIGEDFIGSTGFLYLISSGSGAINEQKISHITWLLQIKIVAYLVLALWTLQGGEEWGASVLIYSSAQLKIVIIFHMKFRKECFP